VSAPAIEAAAWRLAQCRKTVREGEEEQRRRREALRQAEIAYAEAVHPSPLPRVERQG
jgi:hypothetical protein